MGQDTDLRGRRGHLTARIWFHGTDAKNAKAIAKGGFNPFTSFDAHLENALMFGGDHVFEVALDIADPTDNQADLWRIKIPEPIPPAQIVALHRYRITRMHENAELRKWVAEENDKARDKDK